MKNKGIAETLEYPIECDATDRYNGKTQMYTFRTSKQRKLEYMKQTRPADKLRAVR